MRNGWWSSLWGHALLAIFQCFRPNMRARGNLNKLYPMPGQLFTNYFLKEGILHSAAWQESLSQPANFDSFRAKAHALIEMLPTFAPSTRPPPSRS